MNVDEYAGYDAVGLAELVRALEVDAREVIEAAQEAIRRLDPHLNFMAALTPELVVEGLESARRRAAPFGGVPFLVKEGHGVRGQAAAMGCRLAAGINATTESEIVGRYRRAGLVIMGCTNVSELGSAPTTESVLHGVCRNPWNPDLTAGGSSGGAAAAVAAGVVPAAHASDGGGSIRIPAHCCGLVGLKPTRGRTPVGPAHDGWPFGYTSQHVVSRTVRDSAALLDVTRGCEDGALFFVQEDGTSFADAVSARLPSLRIALATASPFGGPVHPDCVAAARRAAKLCETLGHRVEDAEPPVGWEAFADAFAIGFCLTRDHAMKQLEERSGRTASLDNLEPLNWAALEYSRTLTSSAISEAATTFNTVRRSVARFFAEHDVLITPTAARPAWRMGELAAATEGFDFPQWGRRMLEYAPFTQLQNVTGQPAISLPLHHGAEGLPAGAHLVGRFGAEATLLSLAADLEGACPWAARRPAAHILAGRGAVT